jgi:uracil-DNA glycosylase
MSDGDPRSELARIARGARRLIELERASGSGEWLNASVRAAMRAGAASAAPPAAARAAAPPPAQSATPPVAPTVAPPVVRDSLFESLTAAAPNASAAGAAATGGSHAVIHPRDPAARAAIEAAARPVLEQIAAEVRVCQKCALWQGRTLGVPGVGSALSGIMFVGEGPGADEDRLGEPFVGRAGQLLDRIIVAMNEAALIPGVHLDRTTVFIGNVVHCRPPENRVPLPNEVEQSSPYLIRQIEVLKPRIICCLGKTAAEALLGLKSALGAMRGRIHRYHGAKMIVTYHPAACLRNPDYKRPVWEDMQLLAREYLSD